MPEDERDDVTATGVASTGSHLPAIVPGEVVEAEFIPTRGSASPAGGAELAAEPGYTSSGVPTFDYAREKIETRYGTAMGAAELAGQTPEGRTVEEQYEARRHAAAERLAQIRAAMRSDRTDDA